jgi:branched-chain amino acid aminotransferase
MSRRLRRHLLIEKKRIEMRSSESIASHDDRTHQEVMNKMNTTSSREQVVSGTIQEALKNGCAWIEGQYVPIAEARIPIMDYGFLHSDLTYDVVAVWEGSFFRLDAHMERFERACGTIRLKPQLSFEEMRNILIESVRRSGLRNAYVEAVMTRGVVRDLRKAEPRFYAYAIPYVWIVKPEQQETGANLIVARNTRRIPPGAVDPTVKNFHWGDLVRGLFEAYDRGGDVPALTDGDGNLTEGSGFNIFGLVDGVLRTPSRGVLQGITRRTVLEIAEEMGLRVSVGDVPMGDLYRASEIFLTSTAGGVMPIAFLDGAPVGEGKPGPVTTKIRNTYWDWHRDPRFALPVQY